MVSARGIEDAHGLLWMVMSTSAENRGLPGDVPVSNLSLAGLPVPSVIRAAKIATIEADDATKLGRVSPALFRQVARHLLGVFGLDAKRV